MWTKPTAFVFNTDDHTKSGMHWVAVYVNESNNGWYFDSYGLPPFVPDHINRLRRNCKHFRWNSIQLQSESSDVCGQYCLMFLYYMSSGLGMEKFLNNFSADLEKNDELVRQRIKLARDIRACTWSGGCIVNCLQSSSSSKMSLL